MKSQIRHVNPVICHSTTFITYSADISKPSQITFIKLDNRSEGCEVRCASNHILVCVCRVPPQWNRLRITRGRQMQGVGRADVLLYFKCLADAVPCERIQRWNESFLNYDKILWKVFYFLRKMVFFFYLYFFLNRYAPYFNNKTFVKIIFILASLFLIWNSIQIQ